MASIPQVLVTGGTGFLACHTILQLLSAGHNVRTTVRSLTSEPTVRSQLRTAGLPEPSQALLTIHAADLLSDNGWAEATAGATHVLHVASPFIIGHPAHEDDLIRPAVDGTLRVLRAAKTAGVKRVVLTSSFAAVGYGHDLPRGTPFTEEHWADIDAGVPPYIKSKALAERAAWEYVQGEGDGLELCVLCPVGIFGPVLGEKIPASVALVKRMLDPGMAGAPPVMFGVVDVRDAAAAHMLAMEKPEAKGERFLVCAGGAQRMLDLARVIGEKYPGFKGVPAREIPAWFRRIGALWDPTVKGMRSELGRYKEIDAGKIRRVLGWEPRPWQDAVLATVESLLRFGVVKEPAK